LEIDRILDLQKPSKPKLPASTSQTPTQVRFTGKVQGESTLVEAKFDPEKIHWTLGDKTDSVSIKNGWNPWILKQESLPIVFALRLWYLWHEQGPRQLGEVTYIGQSPVLGKDGLLDDTRVVLGEVTAEVYTSRVNGQIELIELYSDRQSDPAEVYMEYDPEAPAGQLAGKIRLQYGLESRMIVELNGLDAQAYSPPASEAGSQP
jgi:hypothetical protein